MKILVTGANGLLGHHVVFELLKQKHEVRIIVRSTQKIFFDLNQVEVFNGNFTHEYELKQAAQGCDGIIHIAAVTATDLLHYEDYSKVNVAGARTLTEVAGQLGIKTIVFVSTANTVGFGNPAQMADETFPVQFPFTESFYARSKVEAEQIFINHANQSDNHIVIINPTFMIGAFDPKPSSGKLILMGYRKRLMAIPGGGKNFVAVSAVAQAVCNALTMGKNGERYLASGINMSFAEFYKLQSKVGGYDQLLIRIPDCILILIGKAGDWMRKYGIKTEICSMNLSQLIIREYYSNEKAKQQLGLSDTDLETATREALNWFYPNHKK